MIHSIISWDCCYRNFFHLIKTLSEQDYDKDKFELIFVEQKTKEESDAFNRSFNLPSLGDVADIYRHQINLQVLYLNDNKSIPYNIGRCINEGFKVSKGKYVSRMDGDLLLMKNFLNDLEKAHKKYNTIINLERRYAVHPVGTDKDNWLKGEIEFDKCLNECINKSLIPKEKVKNKGPLISAPREWYSEIGGYDEHRLWSTGLSRSGQDLTSRLEIYSGKKSIALPGHVCVHPYHPQGFNRSTKLGNLILYIHQEIINYCRENKISTLKDKAELNDLYFRKYGWAIEANINSSELTLFNKFRLECILGMNRLQTALIN